MCCWCKVTIFNDIIRTYETLLNVKYSISFVPSTNLFGSKSHNCKKNRCSQNSKAIHSKTNSINRAMAWSTPRSYYKNIKNYWRMNNQAENRFIINQEYDAPAECIGHYAYQEKDWDRTSFDFIEAKYFLRSLGLLILF